MPNPWRSDDVPHHQLPWTLISDEVIDVTFLITTRSMTTNLSSKFGISQRYLHIPQPTC